MQFTERKILPYEPKAKFTDRYSAGILDNPHRPTDPFLWKSKTKNSESLVKKQVL